MGSTGLTWLLQTGIPQDLVISIVMNGSLGPYPQSFIVDLKDL